MVSLQVLKPSIYIFELPPSYDRIHIYIVARYQLHKYLPTHHDIFSWILFLLALNVNHGTTKLNLLVHQVAL